jgi:putative two-component system response regulator
MTANNDRETIIIVDDDITNLTVGMNSLADQYSVLTAPSGKKLFVLLEKVKPALILLDIEMPEMDGYEVIRLLKDSEKTAHIPVIFVTAQIDPESEVKGLGLGAVDYITKPFSRELLNKRVDLHIQFEKQKKELLKYSLTLESEVDKKTRTVLELQNAILKTVAELVESRDNITGGHIERTQHYLRLLVDFLLEHGIYTEKLSSWDIDLFVMSSQLHDVGKISIKDEILMKPGKLTDEEFEEMKKHTIYGVEIIRKIEANATESEFLAYAEVLAGSHHEKWNGKGYPHGLKGEEIPLQGRLMAIVDVYDALTDERPYKKAFSHEQSVEIIRQEKGEHFDPLIAEVFLTHEEKFENAKSNKTYAGLSGFFQSSHDLSSTLTAVSNIVGIKGSAHLENMRHYLKIFLNALSNHEEYKNEVSGWDIDFFLISAHLYDVGKIAVNSGILNKSGILTEDEYEEVRGHAHFGVKIIRQIGDNVGNDSLLYHAEVLAGCHHEKWDGTGYPRGLKGTDIPLQGRIMAIVDVYDALTTDRPHRKKKTHKEAVEIVRNSSGTHFDPALVEVFLECEREFDRQRI